MAAGLHLIPGPGIGMSPSSDDTLLMPVWLYWLFAESTAADCLSFCASQGPRQLS